MFPANKGEIRPNLVRLCAGPVFYFPEPIPFLKAAILVLLQSSFFPIGRKDHSAHEIIPL